MMASEYKPEIERVMLLINDVGTKVLKTLITEKLFQTFLKENKKKLQDALPKKDVAKVYHQSGQDLPSVDVLDEEILRIVIEHGASDVLTKNNVPIDRVRRDNYDALHKLLISTILTSVLEGLVDSKKPKRNLTSVQKSKIYSKPLKWQEFDISLLSRLLFDFFSIKKTVSGETLPQSTETEEGDDILRIKIHRNSLAHEKFETISTSLAWSDVFEAIDRLGKSKFRDEVTKIKEKCIDKQMKENCAKILQLWKEEEQQLTLDVENVKQWAAEKMEKQTEEVRDIIDQHVKSSTETIKKAISDYREQTERTLETLMERYAKELRSCMTREEGVVVPTENRIEKILENLQAEIRKHFIENVQKMTDNIESKVTDNLKSGMNDLRSFISTKNETFLESIKTSMTTLGATVETATKQNEERLQQYFKNMRDMYESSAATASDTAEERDKEMRKLIKDLKNEVTEKIEKKTATDRTEAIDAAKKRDEEILQLMKNLKEEVTEKIETKTATEKTEDKGNSESDDSDVDGDQSRIKVTSLPERVTEDKLRSFFCSKRKSGGGTVEKIDFNQEQNQAVITFKDPKAVNRVLQKQPLSMDGRQISVEEYMTESETEDEEDELDDCSYTIEVRGMKDTTSSDALEFYFESRKAAGGVQLDIVNFRFLRKEKVARIKYASRKDMLKVLHRKHIIEGAKLDVREYVKEPEPVYKDKILIRGVDPQSTREKLTEFLLSYACAPPKDFVDGKEEGVVLVTFEGLPDIEALMKTCVDVPFDGQFLQVFRLPVSRCIFVSGVGPSTEKDTLLYYFENRNRSGGGEVEKINYNKEEKTCYVHFKDHTVADQVCAKQHTIDGNNLTIQIYHEMLETFSGIES